MTSSNGSLCLVLRSYVCPYRVLLGCSLASCWVIDSDFYRVWRKLGTSTCSFSSLSTAFLDCFFADRVLQFVRRFTKGVVVVVVVGVVAGAEGRGCTRGFPLAEDDDEGTTIRRRFLLGTGRRSIIYRSIIGGGPMTSQSRRRPASHFYSGRRRTPKWRPFFSLTPRDGRESFALTLTSATATKSIKRRRRRDVTTAATVPVSWLVKAKKKQNKRNKTKHNTKPPAACASLGWGRARGPRKRGMSRPTHTLASDTRVGVRRIRMGRTRNAALRGKAGRHWLAARLARRRHQSGRPSGAPSVYPWLAASVESQRRHETDVLSAARPSHPTAPTAPPLPVHPLLRRRCSPVFGVRVCQCQWISPTVGHVGRSS